MNQHLSTNSVEQQAIKQFNAGHFQEAIELYNKLWLESDDEKWQQQIAYCYLQRALSFAKRGMIQQALSLWDKHTQNTEPPYQAFDHYIFWLIQDGNKHKLRPTLEQLSTEQLDKHYPALTALLGLLTLTEHPEFQRYLTKESVFMTHLHIAQTALQAYEDNDQDILKKSLKQIPFHSAFKDLRTLINVAQSATESAIFLSKIPASSAYQQAAQLLSTSTQQGSQLAQKLSDFNYQQRTLITTIKGLNSKQQAFIEDLIQQNAPLSDKLKFSLAIQYLSLLDEKDAEYFCKAMLVNYPAGLNEFNTHFSPLSDFEENRLKALAYEQANNSVDAEEYWLQCVEILINKGAGNDLKIALILRHIAGQNPDAELQNQYLIESLKYDPEDLASYLHIVNYFEQHDEDDYQHWLSSSIEKFPQQIEVLNMAIREATRNKSYKQASHYALQLLKADPLNTFAKQTLYSCHLINARQFMLEQKYHLVEDEIKQAEDLKLANRYLIQAQILRGLFYFASEDKNQGLKLINDSVNKQALDPINTRFQIMMEALLTGLAIEPVLSALTLNQEQLISSQALTRLIQQLKVYQQQTENLTLLNQALEQIKPALENSLLQQNYQETLLLDLSQTLADINAFKLLHYCAKQALVKENKAIWQYYQLYAEVLGLADMCTQSQILQLKKARDLAFQQKQNRAMILIDAFINAYYQTYSEQDTGLIGELIGMNKTADKQEQIIEDPIERIFEQLSEDQQVKLEDTIDSLMQQISPEQLAMDLSSGTDNSETLLSAMMQQANLFSALIVIKAANSLGFIVDITVRDILDCFNLPQNTQ